ncbi:hypothetical protein Acsp06_59200 [Actinomycetospora sp. NBRC 106375]|nr:hypothetical protein Acsp06_59200 [Actinomycetospora sp. NBRC 106375]
MFTRGHDHHSDTSWTRLLHGLDSGDPDGQVAATWIAAQELRLLYRHTDPSRAAAAFYRWVAFCADSEVPELHRLARTPWTPGARNCSPASPSPTSRTGSPRRSTC